MSKGLEAIKTKVKEGRGQLLLSAERQKVEGVLRAYVRKLSKKHEAATLFVKEVPSQVSILLNTMRVWREAVRHAVDYIIRAGCENLSVVKGKLENGALA